jgi:hypothetical protein
MTMHFQSELVAAMTWPVAVSVNWAMKPPSPICWLRSPMYSKPVSFSL